ncbi:MAG TPA: TIGR01841 family phasin [Noviherbaspirillum sp.]|nr:TIGR01841 family phasin [Noviherbaspirillum sp.]
MFSLHEQVSRATEAQLEKQIDTNAALAAGAMHGVQEVAGLNINMARATLEQSNFATRQLLSAQDLKQLIALAGAQLEPNARRAFDYGYYLVTIAAGLQSELIRFVGERMDETSSRLALLASTAAQAQTPVPPFPRPRAKPAGRAGQPPRVATR